MLALSEKQHSRTNLLQSLHSLHGRVFAIVEGEHNAFWLLKCTTAATLKAGGIGLWGNELKAAGSLETEVLTLLEQDGVSGPWSLKLHKIIDVTDIVTAKRNRYSAPRSALQQRCGAVFAEFDLPEQHEAFDARADPQDKNFMNDILCREAAHLRGVSKALILDGREHLTTQALRRAGFTDATIVIANSNESTCAALQACLPQVDVRFCSMKECLESPVQERFAVVYLDYCGALGGRGNTCTPSYEMELLFSQKLTDCAVVAYTFCKRTAVRIDPSIPDSELAWRTFQHIALKHGYQTRNVASRHYRQMFTACFRVERIATTSNFLMRDM